MKTNLNVNSKDHVQGPEDAAIELVEYGDYQCPYCGEAYYVIKKVQERLGEDLKFVFRNFPLAEMHPYAMSAAFAAECAGEQNKFWEMHDMLFENQQHLQDDYLIQYAERLGLDIDKFREDFNNEAIYDKVNGDYQSGLRHNVGGTPALFINGEQFNGNWMAPEFIDYLEMLAKKKVHA